MACASLSSVRLVGPKSGLHKKTRRVFRPIYLPRRTFHAQSCVNDLDFHYMGGWTVKNARKRGIPGKHQMHIWRQFGRVSASCLAFRVTVHIFPTKHMETNGRILGEVKDCFQSSPGAVSKRGTPMKVVCHGKWENILHKHHKPLAAIASNQY